MTRERLQVVVDTIALMKKALSEGRDWSAWVYCSSIEDMEEQLYLWNQFDAKERNILKTYQAAERKVHGNGRSTGEGS